ncbi:hypothetical protein [Paracoccus sp. ME4]|uniref:hypothetical protein n=1 Tax=Paracoccus sp. ME4 TaxID=3138066 RepID=UPI00398A8FB7
MAKKNTDKNRDDRNEMERNDGRTFSVPRMPRYWDVKMACYATGLGARVVRDKVHPALCRAGRFDATAGVTNEWAESGRPIKISVPLKPKRLRQMLEQLDDLCASGQLEIRVHGERFN